MTTETRQIDFKSGPGCVCLCVTQTSLSEKHIFQRLADTISVTDTDLIVLRNLCKSNSPLIVQLMAISSSHFLICKLH